jgi:hypothetical protein
MKDRIPSFKKIRNFEINANDAQELAAYTKHPSSFKR